MFPKIAMHAVGADPAPPARTGSKVLLHLMNPYKPGNRKDEADKVVLYRGQEPNMQEDEGNIVTKGK